MRDLGQHRDRRRARRGDDPRGRLGRRPRSRSRGARRRGRRRRARPSEIARDPRSLTGAYLSGRERIDVPATRRAGNGKAITVVGRDRAQPQGHHGALPARRADLRHRRLGVGEEHAGQRDPAPRAGARAPRRRGRARRAPEDRRASSTIDKVIDIDQSPIGRTPRSNPATYVGLFTPIRDLFALVPESRARGYQPGRFSFNVKRRALRGVRGGRRASRSRCTSCPTST